LNLRHEYILSQYSNGIWKPHEYPLNHRSGEPKGRRYSTYNMFSILRTASL